MHDTDQGATTPPCYEGLQMLTYLAEELSKRGFLLLPLLIGLKSDPGLTPTFQEGTHMIGYALKMTPPDATPEPTPDDPWADIYSKYFGDTEE